jgi:hypothetical protein
MATKEEKQEFRNKLLIGFEAAMLQVVDPEFFMGMEKGEKEQFLDGAYRLYKLGYMDGVVQLGKEVLSETKTKT